MILSVREAALASPDAIGLIHPGGVDTWAQLAEAASTRSFEIRAAIRVASLAGVPVGVVGHTNRETLITLLALLEAGAQIVTLHSGIPDPQRRALLATTRASHIVDGTQIVRVGAGEGDALPSNTALVVFTSGSTGTPKGVCLTADALEAAAAMSAWNLGWRDDDRWLLNLPLAHVGGLSILTRCLLARRTICLSDAPTMDAMREHRITLASLVPTQLTRLVEAVRARRGTALPHLRAILVGGGATAPSLARAARAAGLPILLTWGATEAGSQVATQHPSVARSLEERDLTTVGTPLAGISVRISDGRAYVRSPGQMLAYHPVAVHPSPIDKEGWLRTNDRVEWDEGQLRVLGRDDDVIISGGENVSPLAVEAVLAQHPAVLEVAVAGIPDARWGAVLAAAIVWRDAIPDDFDAWCRARLGAWQRPRHVITVQRLPTNPNGKRDRTAVGALLSSRSGHRHRDAAASSSDSVPPLG